MVWEGGSRGHERGNTGSGLLGASQSGESQAGQRGGYFSWLFGLSPKGISLLTAALPLDHHTQSDAGVLLAYGAPVGHLGTLASKPAMGTSQPAWYL